MTRGKLIYIFGKDRGISSVEFNGDMYPSGHGDEIIEAFEIRRFESAVAFRDYVERFDRRHFGYAEEGCEIIRDFCLAEDRILDISGNITDYLYIINDSSTDCYLKSGEQITCMPIGAMAIVHYKDVQRILEKPKQHEVREALVSREVFTEVITRVKVGREINYQIARICRENARYLNCNIEDFTKLICPNDQTLIKLLEILMFDQNGEIGHFISGLEFERNSQDKSVWNKRFYCDVNELYDYLSTKGRGANNVRGQCGI